MTLLEFLLELAKVLVPLAIGALGGWFGLKKMLLKHKLETDSDNKAMPESRQLLRSAIKLANTVNDELIRIRDTMECDRVTVKLFHNGGKYYSGEPMQKMTMAFEKTQKNLRPIEKDFRGVPVSQHSFVLNKLLDNDFVCFPDVEKIDDDTYRNTLKFYKVHSCYKFNIYDINKQWIGLLSVQYTHKVKYLNDEQLAFLRNKTMQVGVFLEDWDKYIDIHQQ